MSAATNQRHPPAPRAARMTPTPTAAGRSLTEAEPPARTHVPSSTSAPAPPRGAPSADAARAPLRADVHETLLARILSGALAPGTRLVESRLAADLGLSRTPLREALFRLEQEGFVQAHLSRGFSVTSLTTREVRELYPILGALELCALKTLGLIAVAAAPALEKINGELAVLAERAMRTRPAAHAGERTSERALALDDRWHQTLTARCPNQRLLALIRQHRRAISRYEHVYWQDSALISISVAQHQAVIGALAAANIEAAVQALELHWRHGLEALLVRIGEP